MLSVISSFENFALRQSRDHCAQARGPFYLRLRSGVGA